jgi:predicted hotdog family 3-hydroxylacyl-ACP dehydratase
VSVLDAMALPDVEAVVPHRGDVLLIDRLLLADAARLEATLRVRGGTAYSDERDELQGWVVPEIMAQAVAAFAGCRALAEDGRAAPMGLLLGVRQLRLNVDSFRPGEDLRVVVLCSSADEEGRGVFDCELHARDTLVASATLTACQPRDPAVLDKLLASA